MDDQDKKALADLTRRLEAVEADLYATRFALNTLLHTIVQFPQMEGWYIANHALRQHGPGGHDDLMLAAPVTDEMLAKRMASVAALHPPQWAQKIEEAKRGF